MRRIRVDNVFFVVSHGSGHAVRVGGLEDAKGVCW